MDQLVTRFRRQRVQAIVVLGGVEATYEGLVAILTRLAGKDVPLFALPGDRASLSGWQAAMATLGARAVDLTRVKGLVLGGFNLVGIPGYGLHHHLLAKEQGCSYEDHDLEEVRRRVQQLPGVPVLLAHGPPRRRGKMAVDRAWGAINAGDPRLTRLMRQANISFGFFAHFHESAGRATTTKGQPVAEKTWSTSLLLNVGSADPIPHQDLTGSWSLGTAAVVELQSGKARYQMIHFKGAKDGVSFDRSEVVR